MSSKAATTMSGRSGKPRRIVAGAVKSDKIRYMSHTKAQSAGKWAVKKYASAFRALAK